MDSMERLEILKEVGEEIVTEQELKELLETKSKIMAYDGFEPSGLAHVPFGLLRALNVQKMLKAKIDFTLFLADYHAFANNKLSGDLESIKKCSDYFIEVWKAAGLDTKKIKIVYASDIIKAPEYFDMLLKISKQLTLQRVLRAVTIMGRSEKDSLTSAQLLYPAMQVTDIFQLNVDICQLGMDQRRANMLAREIAEKINRKKPVAVHHHMLLGLQGITGKEITQNKMSKSNPKSAILVHDSEDEIKKKINSAFCEAKNIENNPLLDYSKHLIFEKFSSFEINRPAKFGGNESFSSYADLEKSFAEGKLHPMDLKNSVSNYMEQLIAPVRKHFEKDSKAKRLFEEIKALQVTR